MNTTVNGFAKINLFLDILGNRTDGYHEISGVFQSVDLHDRVFIEVSRGEGVSVRGVPGVPPEDNSAYKAAAFFLKRYSIISRIEIDIEKGIPLSGGLGGSSADAAAVLNGLSGLFAVGKDKDFYKDVAFEVGADVPFMMVGGLALVEGMGERVSPLEGRLNKPLVIGYPGVEVNTGWAYGAASFPLTPKNNTCKILLRCLMEDDYDAWNDALYNRFEDIVFNEYPQVFNLKTEFIENGAKAALMSGSGSSVFALFDSVHDAEDAIRRMGRNWEWLKLVAAS